MLLLLHRKLPALPVLGVLTVSLLAAVLWPQAELLRGDPVCRVLDVGQGQAIIWDSDGFTAVIDCGGSDPEQAGEQVARTLHSRGQTHVDALVLTHYDLDHAGGAVQLLHRVRVGAVFLPEVPDDSGLRQQIEQAAIAAGSPVFFVSSWTEVEISRGKLVLYPPVVRENDHNSGICVLASADEYDILITGDLDQFLEMRLISRWGLPQAEVLIAGHHGAANATSTLLLETVRPQIVAISVGEENTYGHPSPETLDRIRSVGAAICRTDLDGTLVIKP